MLAAMLFAIAPSSAQSLEDRARIDYEVARMALEAGNHDLASRKLESVIQVLGEQPELLSLAARSYMELGQLDSASRHVERAFAAADPAFRSTPSFTRLVSLAAELDLKRAVVEEREEAAESQDRQWVAELQVIPKLEEMKPTQGASAEGGLRRVNGLPTQPVSSIFEGRTGAEFNVSPDDAIVRIDNVTLGKADDWDGMGGGETWSMATPGEYIVELSLTGYRTEWVMVRISPEAKEETADVETELQEVARVNRRRSKQQL